MNRIEVLSKDEIELIHGETLNLLETIGIKVDSEESRTLLKDHGAIVNDNDKDHFVKFPEELIKEYLKFVPEEFSLWGPDGSYRVDINTTDTKYITVGATVKIYEPTDKRMVRKTSLADLTKQLRIIDSLKNIAASGVSVWPQDVPFTEIHYHSICEWAKHSHKPFGLGTYGKVACQDMMNLASIIVGGEKELIKRPRFYAFYDPTSPLLITKIMANGLSIFAKYKQPVLVCTAATAGATAPVTLGGVLTQTNMEILSSIVLAQIINRGTPVFYSSASSPLDPPTGNLAWGSAETGLIVAGIAQLARFYKIPSNGQGAATDSKCFDVQHGFERCMTLFCAANAGINLISCAGAYESNLTESLELLAIDNELISIIERVMEGIRIDENTIASEEIKKVATLGKNYLGLKHTAQNVRREIFVPNLMNRDKRAKWIKDGSKDIITRAREKIDEILKSQKGPGILPEVEVELNKYYEEVVAKRTYDEIMRLEGLTTSQNASSITGLEI